MGEHTILLHVTDVGGLRASQAFTLTVIHVNHAPTFTSAPVATATQDAPYTYTVTAEDIDVGDTLTITAESAPAWLTLIDHGDGTATLSGTPANADVGEHAITLRVTDAGGLTDTQTFTIRVANVNDAPAFASAPIITATQDAPYTYAVTAEDIDPGDTLTITAGNLPAWLTFADHGDGTATLAGTPANADVGEHLVELRVEDVAGLSDTQSFTIRVANVNDAPAFASAPHTAATQDAPYTYTIAAADSDLIHGDALTITAGSLPNWLTFADHGDGTATLSGTPANANVGDHAITLLATDAGGLTATQTFTISVANVNDAPGFVSTGVVTALLDIPYTYEVVTEDPDLIHGDTLTITAKRAINWLKLEDHGDGTATLSGTPRNGEVEPGDYEVTLEVRDRAGAAATQTYTIKVKLPGGGAETDRILFLPMVVRNF